MSIEALLRLWILFLAGLGIGVGIALIFWLISLIGSFASWA